MCLDLFLRCSCTADPLGLPREYELMRHLGEGAYGLVVRCKKKDTNETVAVKLSDNSNALDEIQMMKKLMRHNLDQHNIVRFLDWFPTPSGLALVMEELDINLWEYIKTLKWDLMPLSDVRNIVKQMAVALDALKSIGVIHGDIKPDNIMMVDHQTRPLRIKLIDFGIAIPTSESKLGMLLQHHWFRAPEVLLGLPFTEAIDMWSLGCLMAIMFTRNPLFCGWTDSAVMKAIVYHCGQPPEHLLNKALCTEKYFSRTETNGWMIKKCLPRDNLNRRYEAQIKEKRLDNKNEAETLEALQCLDLLRAMLRVDPTERITPAEVLLHPFIVEASVTAQDNCTNIGRDHRRPLSKIPLSRRLPVQPAEADNTLCSDDEESSDSLDFHVSMTYVSWTSSTSDSEDSVTPPKEIKKTNIKPAHRSPSPTVPPSHVIHVRPATAENTLCLEDDKSLESLVIHVSKTSRPPSWTSTSDREDPVTAPEETTNIQTAHRSLSPTSPPSRVIHVRPATAENTMRLEDKESLESLVIHISRTSRPASWTSTSDCEDPVTAPEETTNIQPAHGSPSPTSPPSCEIYVRPATAENTLCLEVEESLESLQAGLKNTSESPATITENDTTLTEGDSTVTNSDSTVTFNDFTADLTSEDLTNYRKEQLPQSPPPETDLSSKKKKKKNCFRRFLSWMKKTFCSCVTCVDDN